MESMNLDMAARATSRQRRIPSTSRTASAGSERRRSSTRGAARGSADSSVTRPRERGSWTPHVSTTAVDVPIAVRRSGIAARSNTFIMLTNRSSGVPVDDVARAASWYCGSVGPRSSVGRANTNAPGWSVRFAPTAGLSTTGSIPSARQFVAGSDAGPPQQAGRQDRTGAEHHRPRVDAFGTVGSQQLDADRPAPLDEHPRHVGTTAHLEVRAFPRRTEVGDGRRHAHVAVAVHRQRPDALGAGSR